MPIMNDNKPAVVLVEPEIPQNTGNIARLCAAAGVMLHMVRPLGFHIDSRHMKRAGLDYWNLLEYRVHDDFPALLDQFPDSRLILCTTKGNQAHTSVKYGKGDLLVFGPESRGLSEEVLATPGGVLARVPMITGARSLNLANSVSIFLYEALRQLDFPGMQQIGPSRES